MAPEDAAPSGTPPAAPHKRSPPEHTRFRKGQSGNPGGRPKGRSITAALRELLDREHNGRVIAELIAERLVRDALQGKFPQAKEILDRSDGRVTERHEVAGTGVVRIVVAGPEEEVQLGSLREFYATYPSLPPGASHGQPWPEAGEGLCDAQDPSTQGSTP
jgi:hypothetical protein